MADEPLTLLAEWYLWWWETEEAPVKMPSTLHIRTAMALSENGLLDENGFPPTRPLTQPNRIEGAT